MEYIRLDHSGQCFSANGMELNSKQSTMTSLLDIKEGKAGLNDHRKSLLLQVPNVGDFKIFDRTDITNKDLAYLTAATGEEFALFGRKTERLLFHGDKTACSFTFEFFSFIKNNNFELLCHAHPGEDTPVASIHDVEFLLKLGQKSSKIISARTGIEIEYVSDFFLNVY